MAAIAAGAVVLPAAGEEQVDLYEVVELAQKDAAAAVDVLVAAEDLPSAIAETVIAALLEQERLEEAWLEEDAEPRAPEPTPVLDQLIESLSEAPESGLVFRALAWRIWWLEGPDLGSVTDRLKARVARLPDPARSALLLSRELGGGEPSQALLGLALRERPAHPVVLYALARGSDDLAVRTALYEAAWERLADLRPAPAPGVVEALAGERLGALLAAGDIAAAADLLAEVGASPPVVDGRTPDPQDIEIDGLPLRRQPFDLRLQAAALGWLRGDEEAARRWRDGVLADPPGLPQRPGAPMAAGWLILSEVLAALIAPTAEDPFDLLTGLAVHHACPGPWDGTIEAHVAHLAAADLAEREGYPGIASYLLARAIERLESETGLELGLRTRGQSSLPPLDRPLEEKIEAHTTRQQARIDDLRLRRDRLEARDAGRDPGAEAVARGLEAAGRPGFVEQPLPAGMWQPTPGSEEEALERERWEEVYELPGDLAVQRLERSGDEVVAVAADRRDGAWAVRSADGGATWAEPLYLGLRLRRPYGIPEASGLRLADDGGLTLEVDLWDAEGAAPFPWYAEPAPEPSARGIFLEIPWSDLESDGDGDGVRDLGERLLLTDPAEADSDGDGLADGRDPLPHVAFRPGCDRRAQALAAVLGSMAPAGEWFPWAASGLAAGCVSDDGAPVLDPSWRAVSYLVGTREWFGALQPAARLVVLTADELRAVEARLGPLHPFRLELLTFDRSQERAFAVWSGGLLSLRYRDGAWQPLLRITSGGCVTSVETFPDLDESGMVTGGSDE